MLCDWLELLLWFWFYDTQVKTTLSENPVGCVCGRSLFAKQEKFFSAVFSKQFFSPEGGHFKELQVKGNLFDCSQILTVASFAYKQQKKCLRTFYFKMLFFQERFLYDQFTFS